MRGTGLGFTVGVLPGAGATLATFLAYGVEKQVSRFKHLIGKGAPEAVAAPEAATRPAAPLAAALTTPAPLRDATPETNPEAAPLAAPFATPSALSPVRDPSFFANTRAPTSTTAAPIAPAMRSFSARWSL
ncbi:tripartite tricarboxylate transporter permease [Burkholderia multivorans]|uniref:tripartite tricarboxylate transporter permease n=1 Tax=Burkholderia multivorans TaxID=87883 RepID=UPI0034D3164D